MFVLFKFVNLGRHMRLLFWAAVAFFLAYAYGPGLPERPGELAAAYGGQRVVLCGASYGIGAEMAYGLAEAGARIVLVARSAELLEGASRRQRLHARRRK